MRMTPQHVLQIYMKQDCLLFPLTHRDFYFQTRQFRWFSEGTFSWSAQNDYKSRNKTPLFFSATRLFYTRDICCNILSFVRARLFAVSTLNETLSSDIELLTSLFHYPFLFKSNSALEILLLTYLIFVSYWYYFTLSSGIYYTALQS